VPEDVVEAADMSGGEVAGEGSAAQRQGGGRGSKERCQWGWEDFVTEFAMRMRRRM